MNAKLPPLPDSVRVLTAEESHRLDLTYPRLPNRLSDCVTCGGDESFDWYKDYNKGDLTVVTYDCPCSDQLRLFKFFLHAGIGRAYQTLAEGDLDPLVVQSKAFEAIIDYQVNAKYYARRGTGLMFYGDHGTGKTSLVTLLLKHLLVEGHGTDGYFTTFPQLLDNFASGWRDDKDRLWFDRRIRNAEVLVVDDVGKENRNLNNMAANALDGVFRSRTQNSLPTILTTNFSLKQFRETYARGTMSLLTETSLTYEFTGVDWRDQQQEKIRTEITNRLSRPIVVS